MFVGAGFESSYRIEYPTPVFARAMEIAGQGFRARFQQAVSLSFSSPPLFLASPF